MIKKREIIFDPNNEIEQLRKKLRVAKDGLERLIAIRTRQRASVQCTDSELAHVYLEQAQTMEYIAGSTLDKMGC